MMQPQRQGQDAPCQDLPGGKQGKKAAQRQRQCHKGSLRETQTDSDCAVEHITTYQTSEDHCVYAAGVPGGVPNTGGAPVKRQSQNGSDAIQVKGCVLAQQLSCWFSVDCHSYDFLGGTFLFLCHFPRPAGRSRSVTSKDKAYSGGTSWNEE